MRGVLAVTGRFALRTPRHEGWGCPRAVLQAPQARFSGTSRGDGESVDDDDEFKQRRPARGRGQGAFGSFVRRTRSPQEEDWRRQTSARDRGYPDDNGYDDDEEDGNGEDEGELEEEGLSEEEIDARNMKLLTEMTVDVPEDEDDDDSGPRRSRPQAAADSEGKEAGQGGEAAGDAAETDRDRQAREANEEADQDEQDTRDFVEYARWVEENEPDGMVHRLTVPPHRNTFERPRPPPRSLEAAMADQPLPAGIPLRSDRPEEQQLLEFLWQGAAGNPHMSQKQRLELLGTAAALLASRPDEVTALPRSGARQKQQRRRRGGHDDDSDSDLDSDSEDERAAAAPRRGGGPAPARRRG